MPGVYATGSNGGGSSKCQRLVLGLVTLGVGIGNGLRRESWCSHQCWSRRTTYVTCWRRRPQDLRRQRKVLQPARTRARDEGYNCWETCGGRRCSGCWSYGDKVLEIPARFFLLEPASNFVTTFFSLYWNKPNFLLPCFFTC